MKNSEMSTDAGKEAYILFELAGATYGLQSRYVQKMEMLETITPVPNAPYYVEGVMFSRGQVIPVINLRKRFSMEKREFDLRTRVIVIRYEERTAGLIVDSSREYINIPSDALQPAPGLVTGLSGSYLGGIAKTENRVILIFNPEGIMKNEVQDEIVNKI